MNKVIYIFRTLYSGCGDMSTSVWDTPEAIEKLMRERFSAFSGWEWDKEMDKNWSNAIKDERNWEWDFGHMGTTMIYKRILNTED